MLITNKYGAYEETEKLLLEALRYLPRSIW